MHFLNPLFLIQTLGLIGIVLIVFAESGLFFGFFLPGDSLLFTAGLLASEGYLPLVPLLILTFIAAVLGDNVGYAFGRRYGTKIWKKENSFFFNKRYIDKTQAFYERHGKKTIILCRFTPIIRTFAPIMAGVGKMDYRTFFIYNIVGGFLWTFSMILLGYFLGQVIPNIDKYIIPIVIAIIVISLLPSAYEILKGYLNSKKLRDSNLD
jgi:membrane-associated protein